MTKRHKDGMNVYEDSWELLTKDKAFEGYLPEEVCISLCMREQKMCSPTVKIGELVSKGQIIGKMEDIDSGCIYASISGKVEDIFYIQRAPGVLEPFVKIKKTTHSKRLWYPFPMNFDKESLFHIMSQLGIGEMQKSGVKICVVNGFANEPFITSGYRLIMESPGKIILGALLAAEAVSADQIYLCVNEDAIDAIGRLKRSIQKYGKNKERSCPIWILPMKHRYPCGNVQMIKKVVAKKEKESIMVVSPAQMAALYDCIYDGESWTRVGVTVSGKVANPKNLWVPIGTNVKELIEYCGGMTEDAMIICGGPFSGRATDGENSWVGRETEGIIVLAYKDLAVLPCIRCGMCREACPQNLAPDKIEKCYLSGMSDFQSMEVNRCLQCGLCSYVCPSSRRLTEYIGQVKKGRTRKKDTSVKHKGNYIDVSEDFKLHSFFRKFECKSQSAPHIHRRGTVQDVMQMSIYGIVPLIIGVLLEYSDSWFHIVSMILVGGISAGLAEYIWQMLSKTFITVYDGSSVFSGIVLALLFERDTSVLRVGLAAVFCIIVGKQLFGGIGHAPIHPAVFGKLVFQPAGIPMIEPLWYLALFSLIWMLVKHMQPWRYALAYLGIGMIFQPELRQSALFYLTAAYFIWNYETMPPTDKNRWFFTGLVAFLTVIFYETGLRSLGICFAVAFADSFIPWMRDRYERCPTK